MSNISLETPAAPGSQPFISLSNISVARGDSIVLHDISLEISAGEHVAILGPNGCGKSTLIQTLTCAVYPLAYDHSRIEIFGRQRWDLAELRKRLGVVSTHLPGERTPVTTGKDAVISGYFSSSTIWPWDYEKVTEAMRTRASEVLDKLEATHLAHKLVGEMSAGETRRILIARALVHAPQILLLDEPSNALDLAAQRDLRRILRTLSGQGIGLLLVTHHLSDIIPEIDRVILMRDGRILADGPKQSLLTVPTLNSLFGVQIEMVQHDGFYHVW